MTKKQELATTTKVESLTAYEPEVLNKSLANVRTVNDALAMSEQIPSLTLIKLKHGNEKTENIIKALLVELSELVNIKRPLKENQIDWIAHEVVQTYSALNIADVYVIFRMAINGEFGDLYESLDVPKVLKWFSVYFDERCEAAAELSQNDRIWDKGGNMTSERMTKHFNELERKFKKGIK